MAKDTKPQMDVATPEFEYLVRIDKDEYENEAATYGHVSMSLFGYLSDRDFEWRDGEKVYTAFFHFTKGNYYRSKHKMSAKQFQRIRPWVLLAADDERRTNDAPLSMPRRRTVNVR